MKRVSKMCFLLLFAALVGVLMPKSVSFALSPSQPWSFKSSVTVKAGTKKNVFGNGYYHGAATLDGEHTKFKVISQTNKSVAKVVAKSGGPGTLIITGLKKGKSVVTVQFTGRVREEAYGASGIYYKYGPTVTSTKKVTITVKEQNPPKLKTDDINLQLGKATSYGDVVDETEYRSVSPDANVSKISVTASDSSIVSINTKRAEFKVKALKEGSCTLDIKVFLKTPVKGKKQYNFTINVSVTLGSGLKQPDGSFISWDKLVKEGIITVEENEFEEESIITGCNTEKLNGELTVPKYIIQINEGAFSGAKLMTGVTLPKSITSYGKKAFYACESLTSITIPEGVETLPSNIFTACTSLSSVTLPNTVKILGGGAFRGCKSLTSFTIPESVQTIGENCFIDCSITNLVVPSSVTKIREGAFTGIATVQYSGSAEGAPWGAGQIVAG